MSIARSGLFLYTANMLSMMSGYAFWVIVTKLMGAESAEVIGLSSSTIALSTLFATISLLGLPGGAQRFIGKFFFEKDFASISTLVKSCLIIVLLTSVSASLIILFLGEEVISITKLSWELLMISMMILVALTVYQILFSILIAISQSKYLLLTVIAQGISKILIMIVLVYSGFGLTGLLISYLASTVISIPIMFVGTFSMIRISTSLRFLTNTKRLIGASLAHWVPAMVSTIGGQLSVLVVISYSSAVQAGEYYIASIIFSAVIAVPLALINVAFPIMSGKLDESRILIRKVVKIGLMFSVPLAVIAAVYSPDILTLLDPSLANASLLQMIFMIAVVPTVLNYGMYYLFYAQGEYRTVLAIGITDNLSKVILYFVLVPQFDVMGAVMAFIAGPFIAFLFIQTTKRRYLDISWKRLIVIIVTPTLIGTAIVVTGLNPVIGIPVILSSSFYIYIRFVIIDIQELREIIYAILPETLAKKFYPRVELMARAIGQTIIFSD